MKAIKTIALMSFSLGIAILVKYWGFYQWVEDNSWIGLFMTIGGAAGIILLFDNEGL